MSAQASPYALHPWHPERVFADVRAALIERPIPPLYSGEETPLAEKIVAAKLFLPQGRWTWLVFECQIQEDGDVLLFAWVRGNHPHDDELGYASLRELTAAHVGPTGRAYCLPVEIDTHFKPTPFATLEAKEAALARVFEEA